MVPPELEPLLQLGMNLGWLSDVRVRALFRSIDPVAWDSRHDPTGLLATLGTDRLAELAGDEALIATATAVRDDLVAQQVTPRWFDRRGTGPLQCVAYFSPEFGIAPGLPQYSGGLGVLAGDHLKAADALGVPLVGVGLLYRQGYFAQSLDASGHQQSRFTDLDLDVLPVVEQTGVRVEVDIAGARVVARVWRADVGRIALYLLDTDVDDNLPAHRQITDRLYGGDSRHRLHQELVLGIGGVRALEALGIEPQVFHINEGHAGFLALERIRRCLADGLDWDAARAAVASGGLFTTHTPVPAGIDRFDRSLMEEHFAGWCVETGVPVDDLLALGREPHDDNAADRSDGTFNMAVMSLRLSGAVNGVSELHARVSRSMFAGVWPDRAVDEVPIGAVTNGVHARTWTGDAMATLLGRHLGHDWAEAPAERWADVTSLPASDLWSARNAARAQLVDQVRRRLARQQAERGADSSWCGDALDPHALTIGFARRFATYKRAALLLSDPDRLRALVGDDSRPVQFVFAGKAHPADGPGQELVARVVAAADDPALRHRFVFVEDYDIALARVLVQGCDVWLNTPVRPHEACGTSGMKVVYNGGLNCSVLDGWWDECHAEGIGWAIPSADPDGTGTPGAPERDALDGVATFEVLEGEVAPRFFSRDPNGLPVDWLTMVTRALATLGPQLEAGRMVRQYVEWYYEPAAHAAG
jgi:glycogen phosphorylase